MIIIVYSEMTGRTVASRLGDAEYSYYFVLKEFRPVLERLGSVVTVEDPATQVDRIYHEATQRGEACVFLSFSAPHRTPLGLACPTIPVLAWEFDSIPDETWFHEPEQDWRFVLNRLGRAITHSTHTARLLRERMGGDFPVAAIPAPVWDRFALFHDKHGAQPAAMASTLPVAGPVHDTRRRWQFGNLFGKHWRGTISLDGVVYLSVLNPKDGRKNMYDMVSAFCRAFVDTGGATLVLKLTNSDTRAGVSDLRAHLRKLRPFQCRVLLLSGFLGTDAYQKLIVSASYAVNTSHGEGQCLPLMESMSCGKPAIAPNHTGMADYLDSGNAFLVQSSAEPASWPEDPRAAFRTLRRRIDFESLVAAYRESYRVTTEDAARYAQMGQSAHDTLRRHCSQAVTQARIGEFLALDPRPPQSGEHFGAVAWRPDAPWIDAVAPGARILACGDDFDSVAQFFAKRGARVDAISGLRALRDAAPDAAYDVIFLGHNDTRRLDGAQILQLRSILAPGGKILAASPHKSENHLWRKFLESFRPAFEEKRLAHAFRKAGFLSRRYLFRFDTYVATISEFEVWTRPLLLSDCFLTPEEERSWHGREDHGRWTRAESFLDLPLRDGEIEIVARNLRHSKCVGRLTLNGQTRPFEVEAGAVLSIRLPQSAAQDDQRLIFASNVAIGGPHDSRELGIAVERIVPL